MFEDSAGDVSMDHPSIPGPSTITIPHVSSGAGPVSSRASFPLIFVASIAIHAAIAARLHVDTQDVARKSVPSQVEIEIAHAPPPPPAPEPPRPPEPLPQAAKPAVASSTPHRVQPAAVAPPPSSPMGLPSSDDGILPPASPSPVSAAVTQEPVVSAPPAPVAAAAPKAPEPVVEAKEGANYLKNPRPPYPRLALREGWEGKVLLRVKVLPDGHVGGATLQKSAGHSVLDDAALEIVKSWMFVAARQGGQPVVGFVTVPFDFQIN